MFVLYPTIPKIGYQSLVVKKLKCKKLEKLQILAEPQIINLEAQPKPAAQLLLEIPTKIVLAPRAVYKIGRCRSFVSLLCIYPNNVVFRFCALFLRSKKTEISNVAKHTIFSEYAQILRVQHVGYVQSAMSLPILLRSAHN
jgi:hypothetical protein